LELKDKIIKTIKNSGVLNFKKNNEIQKLNSFLEKITNKPDILSEYISFFVIMAFNSHVNDNYVKKENNGENSLIKFYSFHDIANKIVKNINNLNIFIENISKKETIIENEKNVYEFCIKIINVLIEEKIINEKNVWIETKTYKILIIDEIRTTHTVDLYSSKFRLITRKKILYLCNNTFYSINELSKINFRSNRRFIIKEKSHVLKELLNYSVMIDKPLLEENLKLYCQENGIVIDKIEEDYEKIIKNVKKILNENDVQAYKETCKLMSKYQKAITFKKILEDERNEIIYYIPFLFDFRGRIYKMSGLSPTFLKEMRYCLFLGYYKEKEINSKKINEVDKIIIKYFNLIDDNDTFKKFKNEKIKVKISIIWILISIGEIFKSEMGDKIKIEEFIKKSIQKIESNEIQKKTKYEDKMKIKYYLNILNEIEKKIYKKRLISKDATASVFQHLIKILGAKNEESLKFCNMNSEDTWYDTYSIIINKWKEVNIKEIEKIKKNEEIFNRKNLKKILMTENYGCGVNTAWKYFKKEIGDIEPTDDIYKTFINFYKYISKENILTKENSFLIIDYFNKLEEKKIITSDDSIIDFTYNKMIKKQIDTTYKNKRYTNTVHKISTEFDKEKFIISIRANYVHSQDASLVREILKKCKIIAIHDCFMIDYLSISKLIEIVNKAMNVNFHSIGPKTDKKIFSIFIII
jgi:hypothetical protein